MRVVVTGASGLLGRAVHAHFVSQSHEVLALANSRADASKGLQQLDLLDTDAVAKTLGDFSPDVVVHTAAERRPEVVERDPEGSQELNVDVPGRIAKICRELNNKVRLIYISTDYVFDGSRPPYQVDSDTNPLNAYGLSKLLGERAVAERGETGMTTSLRLPLLYGKALASSESAVNVLTTFILPPADARRIMMDAYAVRYPTSVDDVARVIESLAGIILEQHKALPPILHFQATEAMTKYDMCNVLSRLQNQYSPPLPEASVAHLEAEYEVNAQAATSRPRHCKMDLSVLQALGVDTSHIAFETWWAREMDRRAAERSQTTEREDRTAREVQAAKGMEAQTALKRAEDIGQRIEHAATERAKSSSQTMPEDGSIGVGTVLSGKSWKEDNTPTEPDEPTPATVQTVVDVCQDDTAVVAVASPPQPSAPSSPNPSFSSLRARPTPPGTSDVRSPSTSQPTSLRSVDAAIIGIGNIASSGPQRRVSVDLTTSRLVPGTSSSKINDITSPAGLVRPPAVDTGAPDASQRFAPIAAVGSARCKGSGATPSGLESDEDIYGEPSPELKSTQDSGTSSAPVRGIDIEGPHPGKWAEGEGQATGLSDSKAKGKDAGLIFRIKVGDPHKVSESMTGHILYTVRTQTEAVGFRASQFSVLRRYSDFRWLHAALVHNNPGIIIPPVPEKVRGLISRFSAELVECRRQGLERMANKVANHPTLAADDDLRLFLESEDFGRDVKARDVAKGTVPTPEARTWMGWSGTVGVYSGQKYHEQDEWFDRQRAYLDSLEAQLKQMVKAIHTLAQSRKDLADSIAAHSHALLMLSGSSLSRSLSACFSGLGDLHRRAQELDDSQSESDVRDLASVMYEYERVVGSVRKAFSTRIDSWHLMQRADEDLRRVRSKHEKVRRESTASHYHEESLKDLAEAETYALERRASFDLVSRRSKEEMNRFDRERVLDLRSAVDSWLKEQIDRREDLLEEWVQYADRCLSLHWSEENEAQVAPQNGAIGSQGTTSPRSIVAQQQDRHMLTTSPPLSGTSRCRTSEWSVHSTADAFVRTEAHTFGARGTPNTTPKDDDVCPRSPSKQHHVGPPAERGEDVNCRSTLPEFSPGDSSVFRDGHTRTEDDGVGVHQSDTVRCGETIGDNQQRQLENLLKSADGDITAETNDLMAQVDHSSGDCIGLRVVQHCFNPDSFRYGTVRYHGAVAARTGQWLGVEWDDLQPGRHDGFHSGVRYFTCSCRGNRASFIRPPMGRSVNVFVGGTTFLDALEARYLDVGTSIVEDSSMVYTRKTLADIRIEVPNLNDVVRKTRQLDKLRITSLTGPSGGQSSNVNVDSSLSEMKKIVGSAGLQGSAEDQGRAIACRLPSTVQLDLSRSLIASWATIGIVTRHLPRLQTLRLDHNRFPPPGSDLDPSRDSLAALSHSQGLQKIKELGLSCTDIDWDHLCMVATYTPCLEVLQIAGNNMTRLTSSSGNIQLSPAFDHLRELNLSHNCLSDWLDVAQSLGKLRHLEQLNLTANEFAAIPPPGFVDTVGLQFLFPKLSFIYLSGNPLLDLRTQSTFSSQLKSLWSSLYCLDAWLTHRDRAQQGLRGLGAFLHLDEADEGGHDAVSVSGLSRLQEEQKRWTTNVIARLPNLIILNGTEITGRQRADAEGWWLRSMNDQAKQIVATGDESHARRAMEELRQAEPRWMSLHNARNNSDAPLEKDNLGARLARITLHLTSVTPSLLHDECSASKTVFNFAILPSITLKNARHRIFRALGVRMSTIHHARIRLQSADHAEKWYGVSRRGTGAERSFFEIDDDMRELTWWGFESAAASHPQDSGELPSELWLCLSPELVALAMAK